MSILFSPIAIGPLTLANRIVVPPMCMYSATTDGHATDWHLQHYGSLALSGSGLIIVEASAVAPEGRISNRDLGLWSDAAAASMADVLKRIRAFSDTPLAVQLGHAGRKGGRDGISDDTLPPERGGWELVAPSALCYGGAFPQPKALDAAGIRRVVDAFAAAAARADAAGYDAVEIHAAHGYLLHQFLSPISNKRDDEYGGSFENRIRLPLAVFTAVREAFPKSKPVGIRISGSDWVEGGWNVDESIRFARELDRLGCAYIHVSGGGLSLDQTLHVGPGYQIGMAAQIKQAVAMPVIGVGLITEPAQAETIVRAGMTDMVAIGRGILFNPRWPWKAAADLGVSIRGPIQYVRSRPHGSPNLFIKE
ncbi:MAG: NADH:flavin oxidoreductase/NADH oxidase [Planctomycetaceae bacterium]|nr:NADH:flavin oxidoreductase/NADH oxidase [Planctomycetaceae bacterium]